MQDIGKGGLKRESDGFEVREVNKKNYGSI